MSCGKVCTLGSCEDEEMLDMSEVELHFEPPLLHQYSVKMSSKPSQNYCISKGVTVRTGKWSKKEDSILLKNWYNFIARYPIRDPVRLIGLYTGRHRTLAKFIQAKKFYFQLGKGLCDRTIKSIYGRARKLLDVYNYKGRFTEEEVHQLLQLHQKLGNKWTRIAVLLNRGTGTCQSVFQSRKGNFKNGLWSKEEDEKLLNAINKCVKSENLETLRGYPWRKISNLVPSRNVVQCRERWLHNLCWRLSKKTCPKWSKSDTAVLIYLMYTYMVEEDCFIDWDALYRYFEGTSVSCFALQSRWSKLKSRVPNFKEKDHESIVIYLYKNYMPNLLQILNISESDLASVKARNM